MDIILTNSSLALRNLQQHGVVMTGQFDFTLYFQDLAFSILPSIILLLLLPARVTWLYGQTRKVRKSEIHDIKLMFLVVFACMRFALVILWTQNSQGRSAATLPAVSLTFVDAVGLCVLSHAEHIRSVRPSSLINTYLFFSLLFDVVRARTLWLHVGLFSTALSAALTSSVGVKLLLLLTEALEKRDILLDQYAHVSPEVTSGIYSRSFFWWLNQLMREGFKKTFRNSDLYPIDPEMTSSVLKKTAVREWQSSKQFGRNALFFSTLRSVLPFFLSGVLPRICVIGFRYSQPLLLSRTVEFASDTTQLDSIGWGLTAAFGIVLLGLAVSNGMYYHMNYRMVVATRGTLVSQIYAKTIELSLTSFDESAAVTLMANDVEAICLGIATIHELWAVPLECCICFYLMQRALGLSFLAPATVAVISSSLALTIGTALRRSQGSWIAGIQTRVDVTANMLGQMKAVKMLGFSKLLGGLVSSLRDAEIELSVKYRKLLWLRVVLSNAFSTFVPFLTFSLFIIIATITGRPLETSSAYSALSLIALLGFPINSMIKTIGMLNSSTACYNRIQTFLNSESRKDHRLQQPTDQSMVGSSNGPVDAKHNIELRKIESGHNSKDRLAGTVMLRAQNASFSWDVQSKSILKDLNFEIRRGSLTFIIGPVGSGKSTLLKALLGEVPATRGFVYTNYSRIAFVDQTPWIRNRSIQENILGGSAFQREWYNKVIHACAFDDDIAEMPRGHATLVGSAGISLSGGQKQRLALARAVYAREQMIMLDDVFSGLDATTESAIFARLLGQTGLLRELGTTVILVTHATQRLIHADHVIVLSTSGQITEQGPFQSIATVTFLETHQNTEDEITIEAVQQKHNPSVLIEAVNEESDTLVTEASTNEFATYGYYFQAFGWKFNSALFVSVVVASVADKIVELVINYWTAAVAVHGNSVNNYYYKIFATISIVGYAAYIYCIWLFIVQMVPTSAKVLHDKLLRTVLAAPLSFFTSTDTGSTINRFSQDLTVIESELPYTFIDLTFSLVRTLVGAVLMCISAKVFSATMPPVLLALWLLQKYYLRTSKQLRILDLEAKSPLYSNFIETLSGLATVRAFGWTESFEEDNATLLDASQKPYYLLFCVQRWLALILDVMVAGLAMILMVLIVKLRTDIGAGFVGLALLNILTFNESLSDIVKTWTQLETSFGAVARLRNFEISTPCENLAAEIQSPPSGWPIEGVIEFDNVSASYTPSSTLVIRDLSLSIGSRQKIGICGRSGSGKSSLITCLFRMLEITPDSRITIDGIDIAKVPRQIVRESINAIPQEPCFLRASIRKNADPASMNTDEQIRSALARVLLWDRVVEKGGLDADLDIEMFSHGQRQLFCLARAILKKSKVVILDEVTSSVDHDSDLLMQKIIREDFWDCTIIAVAHRLDTILDFDKIAVLDNGRLIEFDTPQALLSTASQFRELYNNR